MTRGVIRPLARRSAQGAAALLSLLILLPPVATFCAVEYPRLPSRHGSSCRDPNGYDDLRRAGKVIESVTVPEPGTATPQQFSAFVSAYANVLDAARIGPGPPVRRPVAVCRFGRYVSIPMESSQLARAFRAEGEEARLSGRFDTAISSYLDLFRLARAVSRGGTLSDWLRRSGDRENRHRGNG